MSSSAAKEQQPVESYSWPLCSANWKALLAGEPLRETIEFPVHSDAHITGEVAEGLGPYLFMNTISTKDEHETHLYPSIVLRMDWHVPKGEIGGDLGRTDASSYHGGNLEDEMAALLGLCLGVRAKAGGQTRRFDPDGDPKGHPSAWTFKAIPQIQFSRQRGRVLPWAGGTHSLAGALIPPFQRFHSLPYKAAATVVKAARLHQEALWVAEGAPEMAWLLLVTAVETAANQWRNARISPLDWLKARKPKLCEGFQREEREDLLELVAAELAELVGATQQFRDFLSAFRPDAPTVRPQECYRHPWEPAALRKSIDKIYEWRSKFVHSGIPFPAMMCTQPYRDEKDRTRYAEIPLGSAMAVPGGAWKKKDAPMQLHVFEYIVRGTLLEWWKWNLPSVPYLNTATQTDLKQIPGIGPKHANSIVSYRASHGRFKSFGDLQSVAGIGQKAAAAIRAHTTLKKK